TSAGSAPSRVPSSSSRRWTVAPGLAVYSEETKFGQWPASATGVELRGGRPRVGARGTNPCSSRDGAGGRPLVDWTGIVRLGGKGRQKAGRGHPMPVPLAAIEEAHRRIAGSALRTPLVRLNCPDAPAEVYLKLENLQPIGSFKIRGATNAMARLSD